MTRLPADIQSLLAAAALGGVEYSSTTTPHGTVTGWCGLANSEDLLAVGVCPISGGIFRESYAICAPIDQYFPVDVNVPGCPPRPPAIIEGVAKAIAIWRQRL